MKSTIIAAAAANKYRNDNKRNADLQRTVHGTKDKGGFNTRAVISHMYKMCFHDSHRFS